MAPAENASLIESLSTLCDCDVAASDDDTGHAVLGGDWDLEYATGTIDATIAFSGEIQDSWMGLLNIYVVTKYKPEDEK